MLYGGRHDRHPIVLRELRSFREAGFEVAVVDVGCPEMPGPGPHRTVRRMAPSFFRTTAWRVLHWLLRGRLAELYWTALAVATGSGLAWNWTTAGSQTSPQCASNRWVSAVGSRTSVSY